MAQYIESRQTQNEDEVSLVEIIKFFRLNWKFIGLITVALSSVTLILSLLRPEQYQKQVTLSVEPLPLTISASSIPSIGVETAGLQAAELIQKQKLDGITVTALYNATNVVVDLTLQSSDKNALAGATPKITSHLKTQFQKTLSRDIEMGLASIKQAQERTQKIQDQLEKQIEQLPPIKDTDPKESPTEMRLRALEAQRAGFVSSIAGSEVDKDYLEQAKRNLAQFSDEVISVKILTQSEVRQTRAPMKLVVIAVSASFMMAVLAAIIRSQVTRLKNERSGEQIKGKTDV